MSKQTTRQRKQPEPPAVPAPKWRRWGIVGAVVVLVVVAWLTVLHRWPLDSGAAEQSITDPDAPLASFFTPEVRHWKPQILDWARIYDVNPNVLAIVIQIESCGDSTAISVAGAVGLMQVMPFHFEDGENMLNPDMNVQRGMTVFYECLTQFSGWDLGLALACYNGGPSVTLSDPSAWALETQYYYHWATGLWEDVVEGHKTSATLDEWLAAGGARMCNSSAALLAE